VRVKPCSINVASTLTGVLRSGLVFILITGAGGIAGIFIPTCCLYKNYWEKLTSVGFALDSRLHPRMGQMKSVGNSHSA
jgi:hypothetical protein